MNCGWPTHWFWALLEAGVPIQVEEGKQLFAGIVQAGSELIGQTLDEMSRTVPKGNWAMAIFREDALILPHGETILKENDRPLVICSPEAREQLSRYLILELGEIPV